MDDKHSIGNEVKRCRACDERVEGDCVSPMKSSCCGADALENAMYHLTGKDGYRCSKCGKPCEARDAAAPFANPRECEHELYDVFEKTGIKTEACVKCFSVFINNKEFSPAEQEKDKAPAGGAVHKTVLHDFMKNDDKRIELIAGYLEDLRMEYMTVEDALDSIAIVIAEDKDDVFRAALEKALPCEGVTDGGMSCTTYENEHGNLNKTNWVCENCRKRKEILEGLK